MVNENDCFCGGDLLVSMEQTLTLVWTCLLGAGLILGKTHHPVSGVWYKMLS